MFKTTLILAILVTGTASHSQACPVGSKHEIEKDRVHAELLASTSEMADRTIGNQLWEIWITAPDRVAQDLLDRGRERIRVADYEKAEEYFDDLITYCPHYAEGWNQRAYVHHLQHDYDASLDDISQVLELEPRHFGALAGRGTVLLSMGRSEVGLKALLRALEVNPWLSERHLLPVGEDFAMNEVGSDCNPPSSF